MSQKFQKSVKLFLFALLAICLLCAFIGCSSDDDEPEHSETISLNKGWNMVSFPVDFGVKAVHDIIPDEECSVFVYIDSVGEYEKVTEIQHGKGYFIACSETLEITLEGERVDSLSLHTSIGWNLLPSLSSDIQLEYFSRIESFVTPMYILEMIDSTDYVYTTENGSFKLGKAYWLESRSEGILTMTEDTVIFEEIYTPDSLDVPMSPPAFIFE